MIQHLSNFFLPLTLDHIENPLTPYNYKQQFSQPAKQAIYFIIISKYFGGILKSPTFCMGFKDNLLALI